MLILASSSPRRRDLLSRLGVAFEIRPSHLEEPPPPAGIEPARYARELAERKAREVAASHRQDVVLGADTVVAVDDLILGKPRDQADAIAMLCLLAGRWHEVSTGLAVYCGALHSSVVTTRVHMRPADRNKIEAYVRSGEPMDKAGAYAIQGLGGTLVAGVEGCYNAVVGLPLCQTAQLLSDCGIEVTSPGCCRPLVRNS